jgi:ABC-2 type transport system ATP-binding protein
MVVQADPAKQPEGMAIISDPVLELIDIGQVYRGGHRAVEGITLPLTVGMLGLLGPNGAGKSTLMRIAATVTRPTEGQVRFNGTDVVRDPDVLRRTLGYLPQDFGVYPNLTAGEFLGYLAAAKGLSARSARSRIDDLLELVNLSKAAKRPLSGYSGGMLRRVGIAQALLGDPSVIIVDEPTAGLDPQERVRVRNLLSDLAAERVVLLSTHIVSDIESVAADVAIVAGGRLRRRGTPEALLAEVDGRVWEVAVSSAEVSGLQSRYLVSRMVRTSSGVRLRLLSSVPPSARAVRAIPDLEDVFLAVTAESTPALLGSRPDPDREPAR